TAEISPDEKTIARGKTLFESKGCVQCHGANAEGVSGKGAKLAGTSLTETQFFEILRTGDRGRLGNDHLYGVFHISDSGVRALYAYLRSLAP
ncbi:MAG: cytochrome c, partial [Chloroflexi bacterium]|nr:cytochrome c [Chloroflexota bacterium]